MVSFMGIDMEVNVITASLKVSFIYCIYCFVLHYAVIKLSPVFIRDFKNMNKKNQKVWFNKAVSIIHAITMFLLTMHYWIFMNPTLTLPVFVGEREALCLDIMMGYLWYDSIYEISTGGQIDTLGHHILGLISHMSSRFSNSGALGFYRYVTPNVLMALLTFSVNAVCWCTLLKVPLLICICLGCSTLSS